MVCMPGCSDVFSKVVSRESKLQTIFGEGPTKIEAESIDSCFSGYARLGCLLYGIGNLVIAVAMPIICMIKLGLNWDKFLKMDDYQDLSNAHVILDITCMVLSSPILSIIEGIKFLIASIIHPNVALKPHNG